MVKGPMRWIADVTSEVHSEYTVNIKWTYGEYTVNVSWLFSEHIVNCRKITFYEISVTMFSGCFLLIFDLSKKISELSSRISLFQRILPKTRVLSISAFFENHKSITSVTRTPRWLELQIIRTKWISILLCFRLLFSIQFDPLTSNFS